MLGIFTAYWLLFVGSVGTLERAHMARIADSAKAIRIGDTEEVVFRTLGKPLSTCERNDGWSIFGIASHPRQWLYGTRINLKKMIVSDLYVMGIPLPINFRLVSYDEDDLVIDWDSKDRVSKMTIPVIPTDPRSDMLLDVLYDWHKVYVTVSNMNR
jgi:hypothetical protein